MSSRINTPVFGLNICNSGRYCDVGFRTASGRSIDAGSVTAGSLVVELPDGGIETTAPGSSVGPPTIISANPSSLPSSETTTIIQGTQFAGNLILSAVPSSLVKFVSFNVISETEAEIIIDPIAPSPASFDITISNQQGTSNPFTFSIIPESTWIDLRVGGTSLSIGTAPGSDIRYSANITDTRDANGIDFTNGAANPVKLEEWVKFDFLPFSRGTQFNLEFIMRPFLPDGFPEANGGTMIGMVRTGAPETATSQRQQSEVVVSFEAGSLPSSSEIPNLFGYLNTPGVLGQIDSTTNPGELEINLLSGVVPATHPVIKLSISEESGGDIVIKVFELPDADPSSWSTTGTLLGEVPVNSTIINGTGTNLVPNVLQSTLDNSVTSKTFKFIAVRVC